ncbi:MAG: histidine phosphatase family protein, partial [Bacteroidota bacterium]
RLMELPALAIFEIMSILDPFEDYLDDHAGRPIHWPIAGRVSKVLLDIMAKHPDQRVAVVSHSGVISAALSWYFPEKRWQWWRTTVSNCSITRLKVEGHRAELLAVNDVQHLNPVIVTTQPPAASVELAEEVHPVEKALEFDKMPDQNE